MRPNMLNPLNPCTAVVYRLRARSHVTLAVLDACGRCVAVLADEVQERGEKSVKFNGIGLAPGKYYYRLSILPKDPDGKNGECVETKKLLFVEQDI